jgi:hypothetical protein
LLKLTNAIPIKFISDILRITPDEFLGLARSYAWYVNHLHFSLRSTLSDSLFSYHVDNVTALGSRAAESIEAAMNTSSGSTFDKKLIGFTKPSANAIPSSSTNTPSKPSTVGGPSTHSIPAPGTIDPFPIVVPAPSLGSDMRRGATSGYVATVLASVCALIAEHSDTVPEEGNDGKETKHRWQRLLPFLAKAGVCLKNYPARGVLPGHEERKKTQGQGVRGLSADDLKVLATAIAAPGGNLVLHRANSNG